MKAFKRIISVLLALAMLLGASSVSVFAGSGSSDLSVFREGTGYVAIGDSITRGYGTSDWNNVGYLMDNLDNPNCRNVAGSYPKLVAEAIGCYCPDDITVNTATYWPIAQDAMTTAFVLDLFGVDDNYCDSEFLYSYDAGRSRYDTLLHYFGNEESFLRNGTERYGQKGVVMSIQEMLAESSLITIQIGMGDIWNRTRSMVQNEIDMSDLSNPETLAKAVSLLIKYLYEDYSYWKENFPEILKYISSNAKDATVIVIGSINPVFNMNISSSTLIPLGTALSSVTNMMNRNYKKWAKEYGFIFVDISNVETGASTTPVGMLEFLSADTRTQGLATHPTEEGYRQIARMIISALTEQTSNAKSGLFDISVDLGRIKTVTEVKINGKTTHNYEFDGDVLTVHCFTPYADTLSVSSKIEDGKTAVTLYSLRYNHGYTAYRSYTTDDIESVVSSFFTNIKSFFSNKIVI